MVFHHVPYLKLVIHSVPLGSFRFFRLATSSDFSTFLVWRFGALAHFQTQNDGRFPTRFPGDFDSQRPGSFSAGAWPMGTPSAERFMSRCIRRRPTRRFTKRLTRGCWMLTAGWVG
jgi:hypothetical protein